jgi:hypothetical protein
LSHQWSQVSKAQSGSAGNLSFVGFKSKLSRRRIELPVRFTPAFDSINPGHEAQTECHRAILGSRDEGKIEKFFLKIDSFRHY